MCLKEFRRYVDHMKPVGTKSNLVHPLHMVGACLGALPMFRLLFLSCFNVCFVCVLANRLCMYGILANPRPYHGPVLTVSVRLRHFFLDIALSRACVHGASANATFFPRDSSACFARARVLLPPIICDSILSSR